MLPTKPVDICYYSSDFYAPYTGISMYSLCKNNQDVPFRLNCIDTGISEENKDRMRRMADSFGREMLFHDFHALEAFIRDELELPICNGSYATYIKVFPDRIFHDTDRILFMDGDTIINGSIKPLLEADLEGHVFAATKVALINEQWVYKENRPDNLRLQYALKFKGSGYYNIGIFYANLKRWKEVDFGEQIMEMRRQHLDIISTAPDVPIDEMLINLAALAHLDEHYVLPVPAIYNSTSHNIPHYRALKANLLCGYIEKEAFNQAYYHPIIIHYCILKPWYTDAYCPYRGVLNRYVAQSPWPDAFHDTLYKTFTQKFFGKFVYTMPTEWLMQLVIRMGHFALRTRGKLKNKWAALRARFAVKTSAVDVPIPAEKAPKPAELEPVKPPHFIRAMLRRWQCLKEDDWKMAFAWPSKWLSEQEEKKD